jgi:hypothetical protein
MGARNTPQQRNRRGMPTMTGQTDKRTVATFASYGEAERAVDRLTRADFTRDAWRPDDRQLAGFAV